MNLPIKHRSGIALGAKLMASLCVCAAMAVFAPRHAAAADTAPVLRATLSNGLRVIIVRNTLAPVVATSVNYLVGSDEAPAGFPGTPRSGRTCLARTSYSRPTSLRPRDVGFTPPRRSDMTICLRSYQRGSHFVEHA